MPIRFRCTACGQRMGIARRKVGAVIGCPRCHHPNRVPSEDDVDRPKPPVVPLLESKEFDKWIGRPNGPARLKSEPDDLVALDEEGGEESDEPLFESLTMPRKRAGSGNRFDHQTILAVVLASLLVVSFGLGVLVGRYVFPASSGAASLGSSVAKAAGPAPPARNANAAAAEPPKPPPAANKLAVVGSIHYVQANQPRPDEGGCVLVLPTEPPMTKIETLGLRPEDRNLQNRPGVDRLRDYGGAFGVIDHDGKFEVPVAQPGTYHVLIISRSIRRPPDVGIYVADQPILQKYFVDYESLLTDREYLLVPRVIERGKSDPLVFEFGR